MPLMIVRAAGLGLTGRESPAELDANSPLLERIEEMRLEAGRLVDLGDVASSVVPKPVIVGPGQTPEGIVSRYLTPHRCHVCHPVTGAIGVCTAFALPGTAASGMARGSGRHLLPVVHLQGRIAVDVEVVDKGDDAGVYKAAMVRAARKVMKGELLLPEYVFPHDQTVPSGALAKQFPASP